MDLELKGLHVLICGGSRGIGLACARTFLEEDARLTICSRSRAHLDDANAQLHRAGAGELARLQADLSDPMQAVDMLDAAEAVSGPIDVLVNCAGAARRTPFDELTPSAWRDAMNAKFFTYINVMDPLVKRMGARGAGSIVNVIGIGGKVAMPTHLAGGAANAALMLATAGLAAAWGHRGIRVNAVNPALTLTSRLQEGFAAEARLRNSTSDEVLRQTIDEAPLRRLASADDVANMVAFLSSARAGYVSGAIVSVDGAMTPIVV